MATSHPDDCVSCLISQGKKLHWEFRESSQLIKLCNVPDEGRMTTAVFMCRLSDDTTLMFIRSIGYGTFSESQHFIPIARISYSNAINYLGKTPKDTLTIFKLVGETPAMLSAKDLPAEIVAMIA